MGLSDFSMKLHDNMTFEQKQDVGLPEYKGVATLYFTAHGASETDVKYQLIQTLSEMGDDEVLELIKSDSADLMIKVQE